MPLTLQVTRRKLLEAIGVVGGSIGLIWRSALSQLDSEAVNPLLSSLIQNSEPRETGASCNLLQFPMARPHLSLFFDPTLRMSQLRE